MNVLNLTLEVVIILKILEFYKMDLNIRVLGKSFLGSLLLSLYDTGNITKGNVEKYSKKLEK